MRCDLCGKAGARELRRSRSYGSGERLLVIENVPIVTCPHCGESYLTAQTLHDIDRLKKSRRRPMKRPVTVLSLA
jgi:YgiT-type zinc finger domain-containing protein